MSSKKPIKNPGDNSSRNTMRLMDSAFVCTKKDSSSRYEVKRGMPILSLEGCEVGRIAAVMLDRESRKATHVLLSRLPGTKGYWLVAIDAITEIIDGYIRLQLTKEAVNSLTPYHPGEG